ncbi:NAD(P)-dependent dehydrogenase (short-subunit alcohol dehydrogenase family) [Sphingomonas sp. BK036]|uniref:SDR family oxidoreductase n=1 Tax=Sphingomonas sp. BK036 TaxID=2512122 RepID=UPI001028A2FE|nr:SDR family oxidoreductase [Sphingomonas sp. BK036]RZT46318.1 NAD(P)-dependent dehydrogenase (short-subunit alcohol dehydrogenase family) [Sphingomonas sp. BK036]
MTQDISNPGTILLIGASRGLGLGLAGQFAKRGWHVVATVRAGARTELHDLAEAHPDRIEIETVDIAQPQQIAMLRDRLASRVFNLLFVNAGTANMGNEIASEIATEEYARVLVTNALGPMRVIEACRDLIAADGLIGVMSSGQGSITNNTNGLHEVYRSSKAALNQLVRSYAARHAEDRRALVLMAPGWIRTQLGGPKAPFVVDDSVPLIVDVLLGRQGKPGLAFLDRNGNTVPW